jgi:hypothetical protein
MSIDKHEFISSDKRIKEYVSLPPRYSIMQRRPIAQTTILSLQEHSDLEFSLTNDRKLYQRR